MNRLHVLLLAGALLWALVTGLIFVQINQSRLHGVLHSQAIVLERDVRSQLDSNDEVLDQLKQWKKAIDDAREEQEVIAILVLTCNRVSVTRTLNQVMRYRPSQPRFPVIVSQDGYNNETSELLLRYQRKHKFTLLHQPDQKKLTEGITAVFNIEGYHRISRHYKWALTQVFNRLKHTAVIVLEDDLDIAPDFFEYFASLLSILRKDPSLFCVSAYNDNGKRSHISLLPDMLHRTDFFSGLGWLLTRELWNEIGPRWPKAFWDDWMRQPQQRKGRACIRPEVSRSRTFGRIGVSEGQFFDKYLKDVYLNNVFVRFSGMDLSYLLQTRYDHAFQMTVSESRVYTFEDLKKGLIAQTPARIPYANESEFAEIAKVLNIMNDFKAGVPRTAYKGVVSTYIDGIRLFVVPHPWPFEPHPYKANRHQLSGQLAPRPLR
ncbi:hypothetical protein HPB49_015312 [Dermacentor silvarum]|uniref:Uncharacterized protein n=1 Tax=Dermacentor silvarum TaxID=543639 RepID=A0ACB8E159_DERSI|nr:alpha-1,3-mannosyl-glycoprotein 2-beta-N-acetylglucosaminyltransferase-like [Dermacentor silvarum]KAH7980365.1 hypothetical protein HPB49_015312 [Dermacentor silvarum]